MIWILLLMGSVLLILAGLTNQPVTKMLIPSPECTAESFINSLSTHRYSGAINQLTRSMQNQTTTKNLQTITYAMKQSSIKGIEDSHGLRSEVDGSWATAEVEVLLENQKKVTIQVPLVKEYGAWKIASLDPIKELIGQ